MLLIIKFCQPLITSSLRGLSIFLSTLSSDIPSLFSSLDSKTGLRNYGIWVHELHFLLHRSWKSNNNMCLWLKLARPVWPRSKHTYWTFASLVFPQDIHFCLNHVQPPPPSYPNGIAGQFAPVLKLPELQTDHSAPYSTRRGECRPNGPDMWHAGEKWNIDTKF